MKSRLLFWAWCVGSVLAMLAGLELAARVLSQREAARVADGFEYSESLGWRLRPGARFVANGAPTSINAAGFRGQVAPRQASPNVERVVVLGDSVGFGYGVADELWLHERSRLYGRLRPGRATLEPRLDTHWALRREAAVHGCAAANDSA